MPQFDSRHDFDAYWDRRQHRLWAEEEAADNEQSEPEGEPDAEPDAEQSEPEGEPDVIE